MVCLLLALMTPDAQGVLDVPQLVAAAETRADEEPVPNPFRVRYHPPAPGRTVAVTVSGTLTNGSDGSATCVLNGAVYSAGDRFEGMPVTSIGADGVTLQTAAGDVYLAVQDAPYDLRLPL